MSNGYESTPQDAILAQIQALWQAVNDVRGANTAESIIVTGRAGFTSYNPDTGARSRLANGALFFWHDYANDPTRPGVLFTSAGERSLYMYPPSFDETPYLNSLIISGRDEGTPGNVQLASDGYVRLQAKDADGNLTGNVTLMGADILLDSNRLLLYGLQPISSDPNVVLDFPDGVPVLKFSTSSRRYKQDITTPDVDGEDVRRWEIWQWRDKAAVVERGDDAPTHVGHIAEQIAEVSPDCVVLDAEGEPNALRPNVMSAHVVALVQRLADQNDEQAEQLATQATQIADLTARLEALEAT